MDNTAAAGIAPIFQLLGTGQLAGDALDALVDVLHAQGLPLVPAERLELVRQIGAQPLVATAPIATHPAIRQPGLIERTLSAIEASTVVRRLTASLLLDLRPRMMPAGARSVTSAGCRLLFAADCYEVMLQSVPTMLPITTALGSPRRRGHDLAGQILWEGEPVPDALVRLAGTNRPVVEAEADGEGCFRFPGLGADRYSLDVWAGNDVIICAPVNLDERSA